jgi:hypothetical protein
VRSGCLKFCLAYLDPDAFAPSIMLAMTAKSKGFRVKEVPVRHYPRKTGKTSLVKAEARKNSASLLSPEYQVENSIDEAVDSPIAYGL